MSDGGGQGSAEETGGVEEKRLKEGENKLQKGEASRAGKLPRRAEKDRRVRGSLEEGEWFGGRVGGDVPCKLPLGTGEDFRKIFCLCV